MKMDKIGYLFCLSIIVICLSIITNFVALWLWGIIAVNVFGLPTLTFWQMWGLTWLIRLILPVRISNSKD